MNDMSLHPEYQALKSEVERLHSVLSALIMEHDELCFHICKNLESEYLLKIGVLEYKVFDLQCKVLRIKRKIELIQAKFNRQEIVFLPLIEKQLDAEYHTYSERLNKQMNSINNALRRSQGAVLSEEDTKELKKLYRQIIKKLHPDMNPNCTEEQKALFFNAVAAYENADLSAMQTILLLVLENSPSANFLDSMEELRKKRDCLQTQINRLLAEIQKIQASFPYNQKDFLADDEQVEKRKSTLNKILEQYQALYQEYEIKLQKLLE